MDCRILVVMGPGRVRDQILQEGVPEHEVFVASTADEARAKYRLGSYCCVVVDDDLEGSRGLEFVRTLRHVDAKVGVVLLGGPHDMGRLQDAVEGLDVWSVADRSGVTRDSLLDQITDACELANMPMEQEQEVCAHIDTAVRGLRETRHNMMGDTRMMTQEDLRREMKRDLEGRP